MSVANSLGLPCPYINRCDGIERQDYLKAGRSSMIAFGVGGFIITPFGHCALRPGQAAACLSRCNIIFGLHKAQDTATVREGGKNAPTGTVSDSGLACQIGIHLSFEGIL